LTRSRTGSGGTGRHRFKTGSKLGFKTTELMTGSKLAAGPRMRSRAMRSRTASKMESKAGSKVTEFKTESRGTGSKTGPKGAESKTGFKATGSRLGFRGT
jgi:hypothetical protein